MNKDEVRIIYSPGGPHVNRFHIAERTVVLDEALKDYPVAHDIILEHELAHAEHGGSNPDFLANLALEFRTDLFQSASTSAEADAVRQYMESETQDIPFKIALVNNIRSLWLPVMWSMGRVYRFLNSIVS
ncbi:MULTISPECIES: hypothetical protein [Halorussus]|uniref:Uncharacterized protein n=2 Tax=Halorussus TaxID=1070314 RepID=A0A8U0HUA5_9EURY|nr:MULTISPECIES: hypothetical protein [Halorussus]UPV74590.1 hypothetical protein M0R89_00630 [Halorussus limi]